MVAQGVMTVMQRMAELRAELQSCGGGIDGEGEARLNQGGRVAQSRRASGWLGRGIRAGTRGRLGGAQGGRCASEAGWRVGRWGGAGALVGGARQNGLGVGKFLNTQGVK